MKRSGIRITDNQQTSHHSYVSIDIYTMCTCIYIYAYTVTEVVWASRKLDVSNVSPLRTRMGASVIERKKLVELQFVADFQRIPSEEGQRSSITRARHHGCR